MAGLATHLRPNGAHGFNDDDIAVLSAVLPVIALAMTTYAGHEVAAGLLSAYLGHDAG